MYGLSIRSKGTMANSSRLGTSGFTRTTMLYYVSAMLVVGFIAGVESFNLTIVHNNDVHAHFEQINKYSGECTEKDANEDKCFGGEARRVSIIKEYRANYNNTLVLDAGDRFTGTLWFTQYKGEAASRFVNLEQYDAVCLGNHEFDLGVEGLVPYLDNLTVPVLDANIDVSNEPRLQGKFNKTMVLTIGGERVGIVGFITKQTAFISSADPTVTFQDELETVRAEVEKLRNAGVKVIVGLSHAGYGIDKMVAAQVDGIDVIVGGHSHTFLYSGTPPSNEEIEGPYPTIITGPSGQKVLIVQAYAWGKYMGVLQVAFDDNGDVQSWAGNPVLLDNTIQQDPETLKIIEEMKKPLIKIKQQIVGRTAVRMEGDPIQCRLRECNSGNLLTDAMVEYHIDKRESNDTWALAAIALLSGGGIRASTEIGNISMGQVLTVTPFGNNVDMIQIRGVHLRQAFEHSVANYDVHDRPGAFFQMSGAHVVYDLSKPSGSRVVSLEVLCLQCSVPVYSPLVDTEVYNVLMVDFTIKGGDGFTMITNNIVRQVSINSLDSDVFRAYLNQHNPVFPVTEGRIKFVQPGDVSSSPPLTSSMCSYMSLYIFMYAFLSFVR